MHQSTKLHKVMILTQTRIGLTIETNKSNGIITLTHTENITRMTKVCK